MPHEELMLIFNSMNALCPPLCHFCVVAAG